MDVAISSSSGSGSPALRPVKPEPQETPLGRRTRSAALVINEGDRPSPRSLRLVRPKTEPGLLLVKKEHAEMAADDETALKWAKADYVREQVLRQRWAYAELQARRPGREEGGVIVLDSDEEDEAGPSSAPPRVGDPGQGCSRDGGGTGQARDDDDDDGGDYTRFYRLLGM